MKPYELFCLLNVAEHETEKLLEHLKELQRTTSPDSFNKALNRAEELSISINAKVRKLVKENSDDR